MINTVRIASVNVNGLNNKAKRQNTFRWFDKKRFDIILVQETHCNNTDTEQSWMKDWNGDSFWNHGTNLSKGVSVLLKKSHNFIINSVTDFVDGRCTSIKLLCNDKKKFKSSIYMPLTMLQKGSVLLQILPLFWMTIISIYSGAILIARRIIN